MIVFKGSFSFSELNSMPMYEVLEWVYTANRFVSEQNAEIEKANRG